jgi:hypothetical protein
MRDNATPVTTTEGTSLRVTLGTVANASRLLRETRTQRTGSPTFKFLNIA